MDNTSLFLVIRRLRLPMLVLIVTFSISILGMTLIPGQDEQGNVYYMSFFDAFYFVSYMASTIGFGETPYGFTYPQRLWVSFCIYMTVIGWIYAVGTIIALMQDKILASQIALAQFRKKIKLIKEPFIIFVGYNLLTKSIIQKLSEEGIRSVVIDKDERRVDEMVLANTLLEIPALQGDMDDPDVLKIAGIEKPECKAVVALTRDDELNLHVAMSAKLLNKRVKVIVEATYDEYEENLHTIGIEIIENPFKIVAKRLYMALRAPSLLLLEQWIYDGPLQMQPRDALPTEGKYIVCGYGRMGRAIRVALRRAGIEYVFIETNPDIVREMQEKNEPIFLGEGKDKRLLLDVGIKEATCIIAGMSHDFVNLSVVMAAKKLHPGIFTVARQNNIQDHSVFSAANIDRIVTMQSLLINQTYIAIARPLSERFLRQIKNMGSEWGDGLVMTLRQFVGHSPLKKETAIDDKHAYALCRHIRKNGPVPLHVLFSALKDNRLGNKIVALYLKRNNHEYLMPEPSTPVYVGDRLLFAGNAEAFDDLEYIMQNVYELKYALSGNSQQITLSMPIASA